MKYSILSPVVFILRYINFTGSNVSYYQVLKERKKAQELLTNQETGFGELFEKDENENKTKKYNFWQDVAWMLEVNQVGLVTLVVNITHISLLAYLTVKSTIWGFLSHERDLLTNELKHPLLRYMDSHYMASFISHFDVTNKYAKMILLCLLFALIIRIKSLYERFNDSKINRFGYKKLNTAHISSYSLIEIETNFMGWHRLLVDGAKHKCPPIKSNWRTQEMSERVQSMNKIDRLYYSNLIDFNECYRGFDVLRKYGDASENRPDESIRGEDHGSWLKLIKNSLFNLVKSNDRFFVPQPIHRVDPNTCSFFIGSYYVSVFIILIYPTTLEVISWVVQLHFEFGLDAENLTGTIGPTIEKLSQTPSTLIMKIEETLALLLVALNMLDFSVIFVASFTWLSRASKVKRLLQHELNFYGKYLERHRTIDRQVDANFVMATTRKQPILNSFQFASNSGSHKLVNTRDPYENSAEFNENIKYLMCLIGILVDELADWKREFTFLLNVSINLGTLILAIAINLLTIAETVSQLLVILTAMAATIYPLLSSLLFAASIERRLRRICRLLIPLLVDEAHLIDPSTAAQVAIMYSHLLIIENRAFVLLHSFPLTFGSLASILTWMTTATLMLQRFFRPAS